MGQPGGAGPRGARLATSLSSRPSWACSRDPCYVHSLGHAFPHQCLRAAPCTRPPSWNPALKGWQASSSPVGAAG